MSQMDNGGQQRSNGAPAQGAPSSGARGQRQQLAPPKQVNLQFLDDSWERLLNAMERLEQVTEGFRSLSATRLDPHEDRDRIAEDELGVRTEVHLQIMALQRIIHPVRSEGQWMVRDFLHWFGGRARVPARKDGRLGGPPDEYAVPILHCILGRPYELPDLDKVVPTERDILEAAEALGQALHEADNIEARFVDNPDQVASRHIHPRMPTPASGLVRLAMWHGALARELALQFDDAVSKQQRRPA